VPRTPAHDDPVTTPRISPVFVGRNREIACLTAALEAADAGRTTAVVVSGESGVGKTRLLSHFGRLAAERGSTVLLGRCLELQDACPPYWPFLDAFRRLVGRLDPDQVDDLLGPFRHEVAPLLPGGRPTSEVAARVQGRARFFELVLGLAERLAAHATVVLLIEDLHWADRSTRDLLGFLLANTIEDRFLVVATYRDDGLAPDHPLLPCLAELRRRRVGFLDLAPFTDEELTTLVRAILGADPDPELMAGICARSDGNPFFAEELLAAVGQDHTTELSPTLRHILGARVASLSSEAQLVAQVVAAATGPVSHPLLESVAGPRVLVGLGECVHGGVLVVDRSSRYWFRHSLVREVVYDTLLPGEAGRIHATYGEVLDRCPALADEHAVEARAHHWFAAGDQPRALVAAVDAAGAAEDAHGHAEAHRFWTRAVRLWEQVADAPDRTGLDRRTIVEHAAVAAHRAGDHLQAAALVDSEANGDQGRDPLLHQAMGRYLWAGGDTAGALAAYENAVRLVVDRETPAAVTVLAAQAEALMQAGRYRQSRRQAEAALGVARRLGLAREEAPILATLGFDLAFLGDAPSGVAALEEAVAVAGRAGPPDQVARAYLKWAELLAGPLNRLSQATHVTREGSAWARAHGLGRSYGAGLDAVAATTLFRLGRWREAAPVLAGALAMKPTGAAAIDLHLARARLAAGRGDLETALGDLETVERRWTRASAPRYQAPLLTLQAGLALWQDRPEEARRAVASGLALVSGSEDVWLVAPLLWHGLRAEGERAEGARARSGPDGAGTDEVEATAADLLDEARRLSHRSLAVALPVRDVVAAYLALCEAEFGRVAGAADPEAWAAAAARWDALGHPYPAAYATWREAEALLVRRYRSSRATEALQAAHTVAVDLGAEPFRRQVEALARRARVTLLSSSDSVPSWSKSDSVPSPSSGGATPAPSALTRRELQVLRLVAEGHTNRQVADELFISQKTASLHVSHILAKLGVTSRVQAGAMAHRLGWVGVP
jgi:DNA-binding CsgD family transcriptional regulator/tetratricopeptide (TPR) repeat protein